MCVCEFQANSTPGTGERRLQNAQKEKREPVRGGSQTAHAEEEVEVEAGEEGKEEDESIGNL